MSLAPQIQVSRSPAGTGNPQADPQGQRRQLRRGTPQGRRGNCCNEPQKHTFERKLEVRATRQKGSCWAHYLRAWSAKHPGWFGCADRLWCPPRSGAERKRLNKSSRYAPARQSDCKLQGRLSMQVQYASCSCSRHLRSEVLGVGAPFLRAGLATNSASGKSSALDIYGFPSTTRRGI